MFLVTSRDFCLDWRSSLDMTSSVMITRSLKMGIFAVAHRLKEKNRWTYSNITSLNETKKARLCGDIEFPSELLTYLLKKYFCWKLDFIAALKIPHKWMMTHMKIVLLSNLNCFLITDILKAVNALRMSFKVRSPTTCGQKSYQREDEIPFMSPPIGPVNLLVASN